MTVRRLVRKHCAKCGATARVKARQRHCHVRKFGPKSYCCWGQLSPVAIVRKPRVTLKEAIAKMASDGEIDAAELANVGVVFRRAATKKLTLAQAQYAKLRKRIDLLRRDVVRLTRESTMTDVEIAAAQFRMARKLFVGSVATATDRRAK